MSISSFCVRVLDGWMVILLLFIIAVGRVLIYRDSGRGPCFLFFGAVQKRNVRSLARNYIMYCGESSSVHVPSLYHAIFSVVALFSLGFLLSSGDVNVFG